MCNCLKTWNVAAVNEKISEVMAFNRTRLEFYFCSVLLKFQKLYLCSNALPAHRIPFGQRWFLGAVPHLLRAGHRPSVTGAAESGGDFKPIRRLDRATGEDFFSADEKCVRSYYYWIIDEVALCYCFFLLKGIEFSFPGWWGLWRWRHFRKHALHRSGATWERQGGRAGKWRALGRWVGVFVFDFQCFAFAFSPEHDFLAAPTESGLSDGDDQGIVRLHSCGSCSKYLAVQMIHHFMQIRVRL